MKKRVILLFIILPFLAGILTAYLQQKPVLENTTFFMTNNILPNDNIILASSGNIYKLKNDNTTQITYKQNIIEPFVFQNYFMGINKTTNYASLLVYDKTGKLIQTLFNGNTKNIDTMNWISDPAINYKQNKIAYVSDRGKMQTNIPDNALYLLDLETEKTTLIANPDPYSGGITHPTFDPTNNNIIVYNYYQYDPVTLVPYSTIEEYNTQTKVITPLTFENKNAYQQAFSPDGKQLIFLGRNKDANTVIMYLADFSSKGLTNITQIAQGDFAYPAFSNTKNHIYFLQAQANSGYNLMTATIIKKRLSNILNITDGFSLLGNSSFQITLNEK